MFKKSLRNQKLKKHKSDKTTKKSKNKNLSEKKFTPPKSIPPLDLTLLSNNTNQLPTALSSSPKKQSELKRSLSADSSLSFEANLKTEGFTSYNMVRTKPLSNFQYPNYNLESSSEDSNCGNRNSLKK